MAAVAIPLNHRYPGFPDPRVKIRRLNACFHNY
jgi:hypothetical protein